jgi:hypothetical protein
MPAAVVRILLAFTLFAMTTLAHAEFPPPSELPAHAGLPDPLVMQNGERVASADQWRTRRRPELAALFQHYMYGRLPAAPPQAAARELFRDDAAFAGRGVLREVELTLGPAPWPKIYLLVATPKGAAPAPCFVGANFGGNHLLAADERIRLPHAWMPDRYPGVVDHRATADGRGQQADTWPLEAIIARGYAVATFYSGDVQPDRPDEREGLRAVLPADDADGARTATIMSWAWGIHRAVDYLATQPDVDPGRIAVVGHSRLGKTALVAGAFDERIALVVANQAGCGGSGPSRHDDPQAESVERITRVFPHWFCKNFTAFGPDPSRLPFDQHELVALCAPRPVLFTAAEEDQWANPTGQFEVLRAAAPVYELLGVKGLADDEMPAVDAPLASSPLGYWIRAGEHAMTPADWKVYMDFADQQLK